MAYSAELVFYSPSFFYLTDEELTGDSICQKYWMEIIDTIVFSDLKKNNFSWSSNPKKFR